MIIDEAEDNNIDMVFEKVGHNLFWGENHYVQSNNDQSVKLLLKKNELTSAKSIKYYDGHIDPYSSKQFIDAATDNEVVKVCEALSDLSSDFGQDLLGWAKAMNGHTTDQIGDFRNDPLVCRKVMEMCGGGYTKLFSLYHKTISQPDLLFLNQPMTSLHPILGKAILSHLESIAPDTKFIITDSNGFENIKYSWLDL